MGWDFTRGATKQDVVRELTADWTTNSGARSRCLRHCLKGHVLWGVREVTLPDGGTKRFISCDLLGRSGCDWGCKSMSEDVHPYYYTCPLSYLEMVPVACEEWREGVRRRHALATAGRDVVKSLSVGDVVVLRPGCSPRTLVLGSKSPLRGWANGAVYAIRAKHVDAEETARARTAQG
jgi:hypothetical protein